MKTPICCGKPMKAFATSGVVITFVYFQCTKCGSVKYSEERER